MKAKAAQYVEYHDNVYDLQNAPICSLLQIQRSDAVWNVKNCVFNVNVFGTSNIQVGNVVYFNDCNFNINAVNGEILRNEWHAENCKFNVNTLNSILFAFLNSKLKTCQFNIVNNLAKSWIMSDSVNSAKGGTVLDNCTFNYTPNSDNSLYLINATIKNSTIPPSNQNIFYELENCRIGGYVIKIVNDKNCQYLFCLLGKSQTIYRTAGGTINHVDENVKIETSSDGAYIHIFYTNYKENTYTVLTTVLVEKTMQDEANEHFNHKQN